MPQSHAWLQVCAVHLIRVTCLKVMCDVCVNTHTHTHKHTRVYLFKCAMRCVHVCVTWLIHMWLSVRSCSAAYACLYVWCDSFICVTWLNHMQLSMQSSSTEYACLYMWCDSFICVKWLNHMCDGTHVYMWRDSSICVTWLNHMSLSVQSSSAAYACS